MAVSFGQHPGHRNCRDQRNITRAPAPAASAPEAATISTGFSYPLSSRAGERVAKVQAHRLEYASIILAKQSEFGLVLILPIASGPTPSV
jgi:hypothetical protein